MLDSVTRHYVKLFSSIVHSTIWDADAETSKLWVTMLAIADVDGEVIMTIPGLARLARVGVEFCESALQTFHEPDKYSWTKENEGRRIETIEGGWRLLNYAKYRHMLSEADQKQKAAARWKRWYERKKANASSNTSNVEQTPPSDIKRKQRQVDVDVDVEVVSQKLRANARFPKKRIDLSKEANPNCGPCAGTGWRKSYVKPRSEEPCECAAPNAAWKTP